jgi:hypothetical protein
MNCNKKTQNLDNQGFNLDGTIKIKHFVQFENQGQELPTRILTKFHGLD